jgi:hypothetical protein
MAQIANSILGRQKFGTQKPIRIAGLKGNCTGRNISKIFFTRHDMLSRIEQIKRG